MLGATGGVLCPCFYACRVLLEVFWRGVIRESIRNATIGMEIRGKNVKAVLNSMLFETYQHVSPRDATVVEKKYLGIPTHLTSLLDPQTKPGVCLRSRVVNSVPQCLMNEIVLSSTTGTQFKIWSLSNTNLMSRIALPHTT